MYVIETHWTKIGLKLKLKSDWKGKEENFEFYSAYLEYNKNYVSKAITFVPFIAEKW